MKKILLVISLLFVLFSFLPTFYEIQQSKYIPADREFVLQHNYMFDYNFYLSRIRQGMEGRSTVIETYYNQPHAGSLFQILYLWAGKIGVLFHLSSEAIYHLMRFLFGFLLLVTISFYIRSIFKGGRQIIAFLLVVTAGSWPILVKVGDGYRFATHMGWWSVMDSLQRITTIPHILFGQIFLILFLWRFSNDSFPLRTRVLSLRYPKFRFNGRLSVTNLFSKKPDEAQLEIPPSSHPLLNVLRRSSKFIPHFNVISWGIVGLIVGIIFPPTLVIVYPTLIILSFLEIMKLPKDRQKRKEYLLQWLKTQIIPRVVFILISLPSFIYLQKMFQILPWSALAVFDIQHRTPLPYYEYALALGPILPLGMAGVIFVISKGKKQLFTMVSWVIAIVLLILIFERVPQQSPLRFTEGLITLPLGILSTYFLFSIWQWAGQIKKSYTKLLKAFITAVIVFTILMGLSVMLSMVLWLTDQADARRAGTWLVPTGAQIGYPLKDFMDAIRFLRINTKHEDVVLSYETAGNFIGAYAGNFLYIGHANTPDEDKKLPITKEFFAGKMSQNQVKEFLQKERVSYIFFGPQEKEVGGINDLVSVYSGLKIAYQNPRVILYQITLRSTSGQANNKFF